MKGLRDWLAASAGVVGAATYSGMGCRALAPPASSGLNGVPIGSGGIGVSAAAIGAAASVVATTILVVIFPGRFVRKTVEGCAVSTALFVPSVANLAGGFDRSGKDEASLDSAAESCVAIRVPSGRTDVVEPVWDR